MVKFKATLGTFMNGTFIVFADMITIYVIHETDNLWEKKSPTCCSYNIIYENSQKGAAPTLPPNLRNIRESCKSVDKKRPKN